MRKVLSRKQIIGKIKRQTVKRHTLACRILRKSLSEEDFYKRFDIVFKISRRDVPSLPLIDLICTTLGKALARTNWLFCLDIDNFEKVTIYRTDKINF